MLKRIVHYSVFFCFPVAVVAQKEANNWVFGTNSGINFTTSPVSTFSTVINTSEGCASMSDQSGNLLFYTDGVRVWNRNHQVMPNGSGLAGHSSSTQSAIILPFPDHDSLYYIITADAIECGLGININCGDNGIRYSLVNIKLNGGLGSVILKNRPLAPMKMHEKLTAVKHANGRDFWIMTHKYGSNEFYEFLLTADGIDSIPRIFAAGSAPMAHESRLGQLKFSPDGKRMAAAYYKDHFELYKFDNATGQVSEPIIIPSEKTGNQLGPYGVEFSCNSQLLYLNDKINSYTIFSITYHRYKLKQYDISVHNEAAILGSRYIVDSVTSGDSTSGALQMGPDGYIYMSLLNKSPGYGKTLGAITAPSIKGAGCNYIKHYISLPANMRVNLGLPAFIQSYFNPLPSFTAQDNCYSETVSFSLTGINTIDSVRWYFGDAASGQANTSTLPYPVHQFTGSGFYHVETYVYCTCRTDIIRKWVAVGGSNQTLGADITLCEGESTVLRPAVAGATYEWQDGSAADSLKVTQPGTYWIRITLGDCVSTDTIRIHFTARPTPDLGPDRAICENGWPLQLGGEIPGASYEWQNGAVTPFFNVMSPGLYWQKVTVNGCSTTDTITITSLPAPLFDFGPDTTLCSGTPYLLVPSQQAGHIYLWNNGSTGNQATVETTGLYWCQVTAGNNCIHRDSIHITYKPVPAFSLGNDTSLCENQLLRFDLAGTGDHFLWQDYSSSPWYQVSEGGLYFVTVSKNGCDKTDSIFVAYLPLPQPALPADTIFCEGSSLVLDAGINGNITAYLWNNDETTRSITVRSAGVYQVTASNICGHKEQSSVISAVSCGIFFPSAFTPNNDGLNDDFRVIHPYGIKQYALRVYNRWGELIFNTSDPFKGWDGTVKGVRQNTATFVYFAEIVLQDDTKTQSKGKVTLIR